MQGPTYRPSSPCASLKMLLLAGLAALLLPPLANCDPGRAAPLPSITVSSRGGGGAATDGDGSWHVARASWYGTPKPFVDVFAPSRGGGESAFGILEWGGCGYTNSNGYIPFPKEAVSSYADQNPDFPGSCGRCYEIKCKEGLVLGWRDRPVDYSRSFYYFPEHGNTVDTLNRSFPGNPAEPQKNVYVKCWDPNKSIYVTIIDICPCFYAPKGQTPYVQASCCYNTVENAKAGQIEFDLSFWAYEQLAHPMYPEMMLYVRPVDCGTKRPLPFLPGSISRDIVYHDMAATGWSWFPYPKYKTDQIFDVQRGGAGVGGSPAACAEVNAGGGMTFWCRNCSNPGYQPFRGAASLEFWAASVSNPGSVPAVRLVIGDTEASRFCNSEVHLMSTSSTDQRSGNYYHYVIPITSFNCPPEVLETSDTINIQSTASTDQQFCVDEVKINHAT